MKIKYIYILMLISYIVLYGCKEESKNVINEEIRLPNIVLFLADDMTWRDCEPYGNPDVKTPNIQKLADEGVCFDNMFTSTAMCAPTRQQLMTGLFPVRNGAFPNHSEVYDGVKSFGHYFGELGYKVALIGKQHYGPDESFPIEYLGGRQHDDGKNGVDIDLKKTQKIINGDKPFFLIIAQNQPHSPWNRGNPEQYNTEELDIPEYMVDVSLTRESLTKYYAEITYMDSLLGKTLNYVDVADKTDNTISIFTSEQGYYYPFGKWTNYDLGLKTAFIAKWPGKIKPKTRNKAMTQYVDIVPTLLDAIGVDYEKINTGISDAKGNMGFDGKSFLQAFLGNTEKHRNYTFGVQTTRGIFYGPETYPIRSIRSEKYRYIQNLSHEVFFKNMITENHEIYKTWLANSDEHEADWIKRYQKRPFEELYNLDNDPFEKHNIVENPEMENVKKELSNELKTWMEQQGDEGLATEMRALGRQHVIKKGHPGIISHNQKVKQGDN